MKTGSSIKNNAVYVLFAFLMISALFLSMGQSASAESRGSFKLKVGNTRRLQSQGGSAPYTWSTSNSGVATVTADSDNAAYATVLGVGEGSAVITLHSWRVVANWTGGDVEQFTETWTVTVTASGTTSTSGSSGTTSSFGTSGTTGSSAPSSIKLNKSKLTLKIGKTKALKYTLSPSGSKSNVTYKSSNSKVASVSSSGVITAKKAGKAKITVKTANGKKATCKVTVKAPTAKKITLQDSSLILYKGDKQTLSYKLSPANAAGKVTFKSSKTSVITVSDKGVVKAKKAGTATVTATLANGRKSTCKITVYTNPSGISLSETTLCLATGDTSVLTYTLPETTDYTTVSWKTSNSSVATVSSDGKITAKENGTAIVTVTTANGKSASCQVTVDGPHITSLSIVEEQQYLKKGETYQLHYDVFPSVYVDTLTWSSSDSSVVTVDSNGKITAVQAGTATVKVSATFSEAQISGSTVTTIKRRFSDSCEITVAEGSLY